MTQQSYPCSMHLLATFPDNAPLGLVGGFERPKSSRRPSGVAVPCLNLLALNLHLAEFLQQRTLGKKWHRDMQHKFLFQSFLPWVANFSRTTRRC